MDELLILAFAVTKTVVRSLPPFAMKRVKAVRVNKPKTGGDRR